MKNILLLLTSFLAVLHTNSQSLVNEDFESWIDNTAFIDPEGWVTLNDFNAEFGLPVTVIKSTESENGMYAAHMQTFTFVDGNNNTDTLPAAMVYGTDINGSLQYPWSKRLKTISFYYKYKPNGADTGIFFLSVGYRDKKNNRLVDQGGAFFIFTTEQKNYTKVSLPLYWSSNYKCDTIKIAFLNSLEKANGNRNKPGTILLIDHVSTEWENFPVVAIQPNPESEIKVFPNPAEDRLFISGWSDPSSEVVVTDLQGRVIKKGTLETNAIDITALKSGMYMISLLSSENETVQKYFYKK